MYEIYLDPIHFQHPVKITLRTKTRFSEKIGKPLNKLTKRN